MAATIHSFSRTQHRFFDNVVAFTTSVSALGVAVDAQASGIARGFARNDYVTFEGNPIVTNAEFRFFPLSSVSIIARSSWPDVLEFEEHPLNANPPRHPIELKGIFRAHASMIASAYVQYYESTKSMAINKYSENTDKWSSVWNLGRVVRNALAHNDTVTFENPRAKTVAWRSLSYSPSDNGRKLLFHDLTPVELILLMAELDADV